MKIFKSIAKYLFSPRGFGEKGIDVFVGFPRIIRGRKHIAIRDSTKIGSHCWIEAVTRYRNQNFNPTIDIGREVQIGRYATITAVDEIVIGDGCLISEYVYISDHEHNVFNKSEIPLVARPLSSKGRVKIGNRCFIGFRAIILPGVTLGDHCVVGASSVVTKSFEPGSVVAGVPARKIRNITTQ